MVLVRYFIGERTVAIDYERGALRVFIDGSIVAIYALHEVKRGVLEVATICAAIYGREPTEAERREVAKEIKEFVHVVRGVFTDEPCPMI